MRHSLATSENTENTETTTHREKDQETKTENIPTRLSCHPLHVVAGHVQGSGPVRVEHAEYGQGSQVVSVHLVPAGAEFGRAPRRQVVVGLRQHGLARLSDPPGQNPMAARRPPLQVRLLAPAEVQHGVSVIVPPQERDPGAGVHLGQGWGPQGPQQGYEEHRGGPASVGPHPDIRDGSGAFSGDLNRAGKAGEMEKAGGESAMLFFSLVHTKATHA